MDVTMYIQRQDLDPELVQAAAQMILAGDVLVLPTDTAYAFAANATDLDAIAKVFSLKSRNLEKAFHMIVADVPMGERYAEFTPSARLLAQKFLPGAITLVLKRTQAVPDLLVGGLPTVGIRMPAHAYCLEIARVAGVPLTATSANISGMETPYSVGTIRSQLLDRMEEFGMVMDEGILEQKMPSTLIDASVSPVKILRPGPVTEDEIRLALREAGLE